MSATRVDQEFYPHVPPLPFGRDVDTTLIQKVENHERLLHGDPTNPDGGGVIKRIDSVANKVDRVEGKVDTIQQTVSRVVWIIVGAVLTQVVYVIFNVIRSAP